MGRSTAKSSSSTSRRSSRPDPLARDVVVLACCRFRGHGQMKPEQLEIDRLRREVAKLKAERDILKKAAAYFAREVDMKFGFHCEAPFRLAGGMVLRSAWRLAVWLPCLAEARPLHALARGRSDHAGSKGELRCERTQLWRPSDLARCAGGRLFVRPAQDRTSDARSGAAGAATSARSAEGRRPTARQRRRA